MIIHYKTQSHPSMFHQRSGYGLLKVLHWPKQADSTGLSAWLTKIQKLRKLLPLHIRQANHIIPVSFMCLPPSHQRLAYFYSRPLCFLVCKSNIIFTINSFPISSLQIAFISQHRWALLFKAACLETERATTLVWVFEVHHKHISCHKSVNS